MNINLLDFDNYIPYDNVLIKPKSQTSPCLNLYNVVMFYHCDQNFIEFTTKYSNGTYKSIIIDRDSIESIIITDKPNKEEEDKNE